MADEDRQTDKYLAEQHEREATPDARRRLSNPARDPAPDEWPDPYDRRSDPRAPFDGDSGEGAPVPGAVSTSEPHPREDPEAIPAEEPKREKLDQ